MKSSSDLEHLCFISNELSRNAYGRSFEKIRSTSAALARLDLDLVDLDDVSLPVLRNGSNEYANLAKQPLILNAESLVSGQININLLAIVPEPASLVARLGGGALGYDTAITSALNLSSADDYKLLYALPQRGASGAISPLLRVMDSHLSCFAYAQIAKQILESLGINPVDIVPRTAFRSYVCDLASRFSVAETWALFFCEDYLVSEDKGQLNRGTVRRFENLEAPHNISVLLIGDSHCYSAISQLLSFMVREVIFIWASRKSDYGERREEIVSFAQSCDFTVESMSERFFLYNHCQGPL